MLCSCLAAGGGFKNLNRIPIFDRNNFWILGIQQTGKTAESAARKVITAVAFVFAINDLYRAKHTASLLIVFLASCSTRESVVVKHNHTRRN